MHEWLSVIELRTLWITWDHTLTVLHSTITNQFICIDETTENKQPYISNDEKFFLYFEVTENSINLYDKPILNLWNNNFMD